MRDPLWFTVLGWLLTCLGFVGNILIISLIISKKPLIKQKTNWLLLSLSLADLGVTLSLFPGNFFCIPNKFCRYDLLAASQWAFLFASVINLCMLTLDRYIAITKPFKYTHFTSTNRFTVSLICIAWIVPFTFNFLPFTFIYSEQSVTALKYYTYFMVVTFEFVPTIFLTLVTTHMVFIVVKLTCAEASVMAQLQYNRPATEGGSVAQPRQENGRRLTSVLFIVSIVVFFLICYSLTIATTCCETFKLCSHYTKAWEWMKKILLSANSAFNPFAYGFLKHDVKREVKQLLGIASHDGQRLYSRWVHGGTQQPKYVRAVSNGFLYVLEACLIIFRSGLKTIYLFGCIRGTLVASKVLDGFFFLSKTVTATRIGLVESSRTCTCQK